MDDLKQQIAAIKGLVQEDMEIDEEIENLPAYKSKLMEVLRNEENP